VPKLSDTEKEARRRRVLDGARRCFARHGYEGATVVRLEQEIGLSRGAIFNWFPSKQELFLALAARDNERLLTLFAEEGLEAILDALLHDDPDWLAVYFEFGRLLRADAELRERWKTIAPEDARERTRRWIEDAQSAKRLRSDISAQEIGKFVGVILDGIVVQRALGFEAPPLELLHRLTRDAIGAPQRRTAGVRLKSDTSQPSSSA
jgi:TetR/AcrR family transcriptional regulator, transcriptional repressor of aconitase